MHNVTRISNEQISSQSIISRVAEKKALISHIKGTSPLIEEDTRLVYKSWFNLLLAGFTGAFLAWLIIEPYFDDDAEGVHKTIQGLLFFSSVGGLVGLLIGTMEGLLARNYQRALKGAVFGSIVGFIGGLVSTYAAGIAMMISAMIGYAIVGRAIEDPVNNFSGFFVLVVVRGIAWTIAGMTVGLGPGIALKSKQLALNGFLGGMLGALIGGVFFDPINYFISGGTFETGVEVSRALGLTIVGSGAGLMIGLVESVTKHAWLLMVDGPLKGKEFILYKDITNIGSSPDCEIYLYKDTAIEPYHAKIEKIRDGYEIVDNNTAAGISLNGASLPRKKLDTGDEVQIGRIRFIYSQK